MKILLYIIFFTLGIVYADITSGKNNPLFSDTVNFRALYGNYAIKPVLVFRSTSFLINSTNGNVYKLSHNYPLYAGIGVSYKKINFWLLLPIPGTPKNENTYGTDHSFLLNANLGVKNMFFRAYYSKVFGFYNSKDISDRNFSDLDIEKFGIESLFILNKNRFLLNALLKQTVEQSKSAGTVLLGAEIHHNAIFAPKLLMNMVLIQGYLDKPVLENIEFAALAGYGYNAVLSKFFYAGATALAGCNVQKITDIPIAPISNTWNIGIILKTNLSIGITTSRNFANLLVSYQMLPFIYNNVKMSQNNLTIRISYGYRFANFRPTDFVFRRIKGL